MSVRDALVVEVGQSIQEVDGQAVERRPGGVECLADIGQFRWQRTGWECGGGGTEDSQIELVAGFGERLQPIDGDSGAGSEVLSGGILSGQALEFGEAPDGAGEQVVEFLLAEGLLQDGVGGFLDEAGEATGTAADDRQSGGDGLDQYRTCTFLAGWMHHQIHGLKQVGDIMTCSQEGEACAVNAGHGGELGDFARSIHADEKEVGLEVGR